MEETQNPHMSCRIVDPADVVLIDAEQRRSGVRLSPLFSAKPGGTAHNKVTPVTGSASLPGTIDPPSFSESSAGRSSVQPETGANQCRGVRA